MLQNTYYRKANLIELKAKGDISLHDIMMHYTYLQSISDKHEFLRVLIDTRGSKIGIVPDDLDLVLPVLLKTTQKLSFLKEAIIVDIPQSTVIATIFKDKYSSVNNFIYKVFSTEDAARLWLGL